MDERIVRLLIVDDEAEIREGIAQVIPWTEYGIEVTALAANGQEALLQIEQTHPDIMLLDIRMPLMNGLELLEQLSGRSERPQVIILSGYDDFSYCREAMQTGAADYLLKPCKPDEILAAVIKQKTVYLGQEHQKLLLEDLRSQFRENLNLLQEKLVLSLLRTESPDLEHVLEKWRLYEMNLPPANIGVALVRIDRNDDSEENLELKKLAARNFIMEISTIHPDLASFSCDFNDDILIFWNCAAVAIGLFKTYLTELQQKIAVGYSFTVTVGIGTTAVALGDLYQAYHSARLALEHSFWLGTNRIIDWNETAPDEWPGADFHGSAEVTIMHYLRTNDAAGIAPAVDAYFAAILGSGETVKNKKAYLLKRITALFCTIQQHCAERGLNLEPILGWDLALLDELYLVPTVTELKQKMIACLIQITALSPVNKNSWKIVNKAVRYMEEHYREELNLETVAQQVYVSSGYLSTLFKQELQKNFVEYLHEIRVDKAKELLQNESHKIYEIAFWVGYHDEKYFSQIFKKITGLTPNSYRETFQTNQIRTN